MVTDVRQGEEFPQRPTDPKVFFHADSLKAHLRVHLLAGQSAFFGRKSEKGVHDSGCWLAEFPEDVGNPRRSIPEVLPDDRSVGSGDLSLQCGDDFVIHLALPKMTECLNNGSALASRGRHVARCGALENDFLGADPDFSGWTVGKEDDFGRNLPGQAKAVGGVGSSRLQADGIPPDQRPGNGIGGWRHSAEYRMLHRVIVKTTSKLANGAGLLVPFKGGSDGVSAAKVFKMVWREYPTPAFAVNTAK